MVQIRQIRMIPKKARSLELIKSRRACAYVRVSKGTEKQLQSFQNQLEYYERYIKEQPGYVFCGIYSDAGISGSKENRPGFLAMMEAARNGQVDVIIAKSVSRFARNTILLLESIRELKKLGVEVIFEEQKIQTLHAEGELMLTVLASIAEEERKSICKNIQWATRAGFKQGKVIVDVNRLLGYRKDELGNMVIDKDQVKIIKMIYQRYLAGISAYRIARDLNLEEVPTFTKMPWTSQRILSILSNEKYMGDCRMQKYYVSDDGKEKLNTGQVDQYYIRNHHPAIIRRKDWEIVQQMRESNKRKHYPLTGLLRCPYCHANLIRSINDKRYIQWTCATYLHKGKDACPGMRIKESTIQAIHAESPITEIMYIQEIYHGRDKKAKSKENYYLVPITADINAK